MTTPVAIVAYLALFAGVGFVFLFVNLLVGRFLRPHNPHAEKLEVYECGEPTIGSSFVQFDLRFYVVALLFIIFDVEVAFFFPWATVFGKATHLADPRLAIVQSADAVGATAELTTPARGLLSEMGIDNPQMSRRRCRGRAAASRRRSHARLALDVRYRRVLRRAAGRLRLRLETRRPRLGPRGQARAHDRRRRASASDPREPALTG